MRYASIAALNSFYFMPACCNKYLLLLCNSDFYWGHGTEKIIWNLTWAIDSTESL